MNLHANAALSLNKRRDLCRRVVGATGDAGLTRGIVTAGAGLIFWLALGASVVRWYDRKGLHRLRPDLLAYIHRAVSDYRAQTQPGAPTPEAVRRSPQV